MAQQHEWMTDGIALDASERILSEYETEGWGLVTLSWDSQAGVFMGCWNRPAQGKLKESSSETGMNDAASDWVALCDDATKLFSKLRAAQANCPEKSIQRVETGKLAHAIDAWCRLVEENAQNWSA